MSDKKSQENPKEFFEQSASAKLFEAISDSEEDPFSGQLTRRPQSAARLYRTIWDSDVDPFTAWVTPKATPESFFRAIRRQLIPLTLLPFIAVLLGMSYIVFEKPIYSSSTLLQYTTPETDTDTLNSSLLSHIQSIHGPAVAAEVAVQGNMENWVEVRRGKLRSLVLGIRSRLGVELKTELTEPEREAILIDRVQKNLEVRRLGDSKVIEIRYSADQPERAAQIANIYADVYLDKLAGIRRDESTRRAAFLQARAAELERLAAEAFRSIQLLQQDADLEYNALEDLGARLNQLTETISSLKEAEASAFARLSSLNSDDEINLFEAAALQEEGGTELFNAFLRARSTLERLKTSGAPEQSVAQIEASLHRYRQGLEQLIKRTRTGLMQELKVLSARRASVQKDFADALQQSKDPNWSGIRNSEHHASVLQDLYAEHLRQLEIAHEGATTESFRLMATAQPESQPSWPDYKLILVLSGAFGVLAGVFLAALREWSRHPSGSGATRVNH